MDDRIRELSILLIALFFVTLAFFVLHLWPTLNLKNEIIPKNHKNLVNFDDANVKKIPKTTAVTSKTTTATSTSIHTSAPASVQSPITIRPSVILQGDPVMVVVNDKSTVGTTVAPSVSVTFVDEPLHVVTYAGHPTAFFGIDLNKKPGTYPLMVIFADGHVLKKNIIVTARPKISAPLGIPDSLGGNTQAAADSVVSSLATDNDVLAALPSAKQSLWSQPFQFPVANPVVTDSYGYSRQTGGYDIAHKGVDFAAASGTPVMTINSGVVTLARNLGIYGNTVVIDHGFGVESFYMHMSEVVVGLGQTVERGQVIGASGETGYAEGPHLHLTVRVSDISIDPMIFLHFFK